MRATSARSRCMTSRVPTKKWICPVRGLGMCATTVWDVDAGLTTLADRVAGFALIAALAPPAITAGATAINPAAAIPPPVFLIKLRLEISAIVIPLSRTKFVNPVTVHCRRFPRNLLAGHSRYLLQYYLFVAAPVSGCWNLKFFATRPVGGYLRAHETCVDGQRQWGAGLATALRH